MKVQKDLREFIELLNSRRVEYLVIGGHAVAFHGYPRFTGDIDFLVRTDPANVARLVEALRMFGFPVDAATTECLRQPDRILQLGRPPNRIDLLTSATGIEFDECAASSVGGNLDGLAVRFPSLEVLLRNKRASGRPKDLADVHELEQVARRRSGGS